MTAGGGSCIGGTRGGKGAKLHALVHAEGLPAVWSLSAVNREDFDEAVPLWNQIPE